MTGEPSATDWNAEPFNADEDVDVWNQGGTDEPRALPGFLDPDLEAALGEGPPEWLGIRWRDIAAEDQSAAWTGLRQWVDWFIREYKINSAIIPACWYEHSDLVAELYAAMCAEYKIWEEGAPGLGAMTTWHPHVQALKGRLTEMTSTHQCAVVNHVADEPDLPFTYHQERWAAVRDGITSTLELPRTSENAWWRPVAVGAGGDLETGRELLAGGLPKPGGPVIEHVTLLSGAAADSIQVRRTDVGAAPDEQGVYWETTHDRDTADEWERHREADPETEEERKK